MCFRSERTVTCVYTVSQDLALVVVIRTLLHRGAGSTPAFSIPFCCMVVIERQPGSCYPAGTLVEYACVVGDSLFSGMTSLVTQEALVPRKSTVRLVLVLALVRCLVDITSLRPPRSAGVKICYLPLPLASGRAGPHSYAHGYLNVVARYSIFVRPIVIALSMDQPDRDSIRSESSPGRFVDCGLPTGVSRYCIAQVLL